MNGRGVRRSICSPVDRRWTEQTPQLMLLLLLLLAPLLMLTAAGEAIATTATPAARRAKSIGVYVDN